MMWWFLVSCFMLSLNLSKADGIPTDSRTAAKKFQNALTQQSLQTVLLSIEERLRNLDNIYAMQYSPTIEGKIEQYGRKLESVEAKISRLEAVMGNELNKISENISGRNFKDDLARDHIIRKIDSVYERMNHRMLLSETKTELIQRKLENKLDTVLSRIEKMEDSLEIKDTDMQGEIADVLTYIEEVKSQTDSIEYKINNISKALKDKIDVAQPDEIFSQRVENITAAVKTEMREHFEVLSNKIVDFHESSWQTYDRLENTLRSMSLISNLTRYEIQNGLRSLTVEVGRLSGGQGILSDSSKEKSKLYEIDKKIDSNFENLMLAQNLFMENCYRLQKDEPQLESKISEVLDEMINTFNAKTSIEPRDIRRLELAIKNHDQNTKKLNQNALKSLASLLHKTQATDRKIEDSLVSLMSIKSSVEQLDKLDNGTNLVFQKMEEVIVLLKNLQSSTANLHQAVRNDTLQQAIDKLENLLNDNYQETIHSLVMNYTNKLNDIAQSIQNKTSETQSIFDEKYRYLFKLFLDDYTRNYTNKVNEFFGVNGKNESGTMNGQNGSNFPQISENITEKLDAKTIETIRRKCFSQTNAKNFTKGFKFDCLKGIVNDDIILRIKTYCYLNLSLSDEDCLRNITASEVASTSEEFDEATVQIIKNNCFPAFDLRDVDDSSMFECLEGVLDQKTIRKIENYCSSSKAPSSQDCLNDIVRMGTKIPEEIDEETVQIIKSNCFPEITLKSSETSSNFDCLKGVLTEDIIGRIQNYCTTIEAPSQDVCLRNIIGFDVGSNISVEIDRETAKIIRRNCFPEINLRYSEESSNFECLRGVLNESMITVIRNYCSMSVAPSEEACLRNITGFSVSVNSSLDIDEGVVQIIRNNCFPEINLRNSESSSNFNCLEGLNETIIGRIKTYCSMTGARSEEACLRNITGFEVKARISEQIDEETLEIVKANCLAKLNLRNFGESLNFDCLKNVLNESTIGRIKNYCSVRGAPSEEACLRNIIGFEVKSRISEQIDDDILQIIKANCFPKLNLRTFGESLNFDCLKNVLNESIIETIQTYCSMSGASSEEVCLRKITGFEVKARISEQIDEETLQIIKANCFAKLNLRNFGESLNFDCLKNVLNESTIRRIKNYCSVRGAKSEEACLRNIIGFEVKARISEQIDEDTLQIIKANCFAKLNLRSFGESLNFDCLKNVLNESIIETIKTYCSMSGASSEEACLRNITGLNVADNNLEFDEKTKEIIRTNCFPGIALRVSGPSFNFACLQRVLDEETVQRIKNYCLLNRTTSEQDCLRSILNISGNSIEVTTTIPNLSELSMRLSPIDSTTTAPEKKPESLSNLIWRLISTNDTTNTAETTTENDYYQTSETTYPTDYDYSDETTSL